MTETITKEEFFEAVKKYTLRFFPDAPEWLVTAYFSDPLAKELMESRYPGKEEDFQDITGVKHSKEFVLNNSAATAAGNIRLCNGEISFEWYERNKDKLAQSEGKDNTSKDPF